MVTALKLSSGMLLVELGWVLVWFYWNSDVKCRGKKEFNDLNVNTYLYICTHTDISCATRITLGLIL